MKNRSLLIVLILVSISYLGFILIKNPNAAAKKTYYTLTLEYIGPTTSVGVYSVNNGYFDSCYYGLFYADSSVSIRAVEAIQGNSSTDYYFFHSWSDNSTLISRTITMTENKTYSARYRNKQGVFWVPGGGLE